MLVFFAYLPYQLNDQYLIIDKRIIPRGATTFCEGQSVVLETIKGVGYTYQWYRNGTLISGAVDAEYSANQSGNYTVSITLGPNNAISEPVSVTVNPAPMASILTPSSNDIPVGGTVLLEAVSDISYSYQWYVNGIAINGANSSSYEAPYNGDYVVEIYNGCYAVSPVQTMVGGVAEIDTYSQDVYRIQPNPSKDIVEILVPQETEAELISCSDLSGKVLFEQVCSKGKTIIDVSSLSDGIYLISVKKLNGEIIWRKRLLKY
jgi:hypothetical protein